MTARGSGMGPFFYVPHPSFQSVLSGFDNEEIMIPQCCPGERCEVVVGHRGHWYLAARRLVKPVGVVVGHWPDVGTGGHLATGPVPGAWNWSLPVGLVGVVVRHWLDVGTWPPGMGRTWPPVTWMSRRADAGRSGTSWPPLCRWSPGRGASTGMARGDRVLDRVIVPMLAPGCTGEVRGCRGRTFTGCWCWYVAWSPGSPGAGGRGIR